jgi:hypothetical protein
MSRNALEKTNESIPYAYAVGSLMYALPELKESQLECWAKSARIGTLESYKESHAVFTRNQGLQFDIQTH